MAKALSAHTAASDAFAAKMSLAVAQGVGELQSQLASNFEELGKKNGELKAENAALARSSVLMPNYEGCLLFLTPPPLLLS